MKLAEMKFPEDKVLEKLNAVSTAKRLANMVRIHISLLHEHGGLRVIGYRSSTTPISESGKKYTRRKS